MRKSKQFSVQSTIRIVSTSLNKSKGTLADQVFDVLQKQIVAGELRPNQRLVESEIAERLGISRTPVREALKRLEVTGYTSAFSSRGLIVVEHSTSRQIQSLFETREALEGMAIKLACERATEEQIRKAEEYYTRGVEALRNNDIDEYLEMHSTLHEELCAGCGNEQLLSLIRIFRYQYFDRRLTRVYTPREWRTQIKNHGRLLEAVRERNPHRVEKAIQRSFGHGLRVALKRL